MLFQHWIEENRRISRKILQKIDKVPTPLKTAIGLIPVVGNLSNMAFGYSENHKYAIVKLAQKLDREGKLPTSAKRHLQGYEHALEREQRAYNAFLKSFETHV